MYKRNNPDGDCFFPDQENIRFYSCSFSTQICDVEWWELGPNGLIYDTCFREAGRRKRKKVDKSIIVDTPRKPKPQLKPKKLQPRTKIASANTAALPDNDCDSSLSLGSHPVERHYITDKLGVTREAIISTLPDEMMEMFSDCCWVVLKGLYWPDLCLSPFEEWRKAYSSHRKDSMLSQLPHLQYWYVFYGFS